MAYTSVTLIQQQTGTTLTADESSYANAVVIPAIEGWINEYLGIDTFYDGASTTARSVIARDGTGTRVILVPFGSVTSASYMDADGTLEAIPSEDMYQVGGALYNRNNWIRGEYNILIELDPVSVPGIQLAATIMASKAIQDKGSREIDSEKIGDYQVTYANLGTQQGVNAFADDDVYMLLAPYKPIRLGVV